MENSPLASQGSVASVPAGGAFPSTIWTVILASRGDDQSRGRALESLCQRYWRPVYAWVRRSGRGREDAEDLTQAFFVKVLAQQAIERADRERGRFRSYLLTMLRRFLVDDWH